MLSCRSVLWIGSNGRPLLMPLRQRMVLRLLRMKMQLVAPVNHPSCLTFCLETQANTVATETVLTVVGGEREWPTVAAAPIPLQQQLLQRRLLPQHMTLYRQKEPFAGVGLPLRAVFGDTG